VEPPHRKEVQGEEDSSQDEASSDDNKDDERDEWATAHAKGKCSDLSVIFMGKFLNMPDGSGDEFQVDINLDYSAARAPYLPSARDPETDPDGPEDSELARYAHEQWERMLGLSNLEDCSEGRRTPQSDSDEEGYLNMLCAQYEDICRGGSDSPVVTPCDSEGSSLLGHCHPQHGDYSDGCRTPQSESDEEGYLSPVSRSSHYSEDCCSEEYSSNEYCGGWRTPESTSDGEEY
jgi:hypothetical protein